MIEAIIIIEQILDLEINLIIDKLLVSGLAIKKQLMKAIIKDKVVEFQVDTLSLNKVFKIKKLFYSTL